jgi:hypothetical protein
MSLKLERKQNKETEKTFLKDESYLSGYTALYVDSRAEWHCVSVSKFGKKTKQRT